MTDTTTEAWERIAARAAADAPRDHSTVHYGPGLPTESELRLLGTVRGRRVIDLGCGPGHNAVALAHQGAHAIALDSAPAMVAHGRRLADDEAVRVEWRVGSLLEMAWLRADSVDLALATEVLGHVDDLDRAFRQIHRVLRTNAPFVFTHPHPFALCASRDIEADGALPLGRYEVRRSYFDTDPITIELAGEELPVHPRTMSAIVAALHRAGFALELLAEPEPCDAAQHPLLPRGLVVKARKLGH